MNVEASASKAIFSHLRIFLLYDLFCLLNGFSSKHEMSVEFHKMSVEFHEMSVEFSQNSMSAMSRHFKDVDLFSRRKKPVCIHRLSNLIRIK